MAFDHRSKHNLRFHQDMVKRRQHIRYQVVGAPRNPFEAAARNIVAQSACDVTNVCIAPVPEQAIETAERDLNYHDHDNDLCLSKESLEPETQFQSDENLMPMAPIEKRPRLECCDPDHDKMLNSEKTRAEPVDMLLMARQEIEEFDENASSDGLSVSSDRSSSSSVTENTEPDNIDCNNTVSVSNEYGFHHPLK
jgi:hypothetical protein